MKNPTTANAGVSGPTDQPTAAELIAVLYEVVSAFRGIRVHPLAAEETASLHKARALLARVQS